MEPAELAWISRHVSTTGPVMWTHARPWATVVQLPTAGGCVWFKRCAAVQAFEPRLTASLFDRWPELVTEVVAYDEDRAWMLLADAGAPIGDIGNPPELWLEVLPRYAELQRGEARYVAQHLEHGVPDLRLTTLPARYHELLSRDLPISDEERSLVAGFLPRFESLCAELATAGVPESIQHDDLHMNNVHTKRGHLRVIDWGDSSIAHPFTSLLVTYRFLERRNGLPLSDPWFAHLRDAYLEPWGSDRAGLRETFALATRVGAFTHVLASLRQRDHLPVAARASFDEDFAVVLRRALAMIDDEP